MNRVRVVVLGSLLGLIFVGQAVHAQCAPIPGLAQSIAQCPQNSGTCGQGSPPWGAASVTYSRDSLNYLVISCSAPSCYLPDRNYFWSYTVDTSVCGGGLGSSGGSSEAGPGGRGAGYGVGPTCMNGSIVNTDQQILGERLPLVGVPFDLAYSSSRAVGRLDDYRIKTEVTKETRDDVVNIRVQIFNEVNAPVSDVTYPNNPNITDVFQSSGLDALGNEPWGSLTYTVQVTENHGTYNIAPMSTVQVGNFRAKKLGLGGWYPTIWHFYDLSAKVLIKGDGSIRKVDAIPLAGNTYRITEEDASLVHEFDSLGRIIRTRTGTTGTVIRTFTYTGNKLASIIMQPGTVTTTFNYNGSGNLISITAPKGQITNTVINANGYLATVTNPFNQSYQMLYSAGTGGLLTSFQKPNGASSTFSYDANGLLSRDTHSGGFFADLLKTAQTSYGKTQTYTTKMGRVTRVIHDTNMHRTVFPNGSEHWSSLYQLSGGGTQEIMESSGFDVQTGWQDDLRFGPMARSITSTAMSDTIANRQMNRTESVTLTNATDPFSISTWTTQVGNGNYQRDGVYDPVARQWTTTSKLLRTNKVKMDTYERVTSIQRGSLTATTFTYTNDKLTKITRGARITNFAYNATTGLLSSVTNPLSQVTSYVYDNAQRLTSVVLPDTRTISYGYDGIGNLTSVTPSGKPVHLLPINASELASGYNPPTLVGVPVVNTVYNYNNDKQLTQIVRPDGQTIDYGYDLATGKLDTMTTPQGIYSYNYTGQGLLNTVVSPNGFTYSQVPYGLHIQSSAFYDNNGISWGLDTVAHPWILDRNSSETLNVGPNTSTVNYVYNDDEDLTSADTMTLAYNTPNGLLTGTTRGSATDTITYNAFGEMATYTAKYGTTTLFAETVARDNLGRITSKTQNLQGVSTTDVYVYDNTGRLTQNTRGGVVVATYGYDGNNNRNSGVIGGVTTSATYDNQDRMTQYGVYNYTYNANGELQTKTNTLTSQTTTYTYDVMGNLLSVSLPTGTLIEYEIDGLNRRVGRKINGVLQRRYAYDHQGRIIAEVNPNNTLYRRYVYASKSNVPDFFYEGANQFRIFSDHLGSPRIIVRVSNGTVMQKMDHDEFGRIRQDTSPGYTLFGFAGGLYDKDTGLVRFGTRDYDPEVGRWTSKDPILFGGGDANLFSYVAQDPVNWVDPSGKFLNVPGAAIGFISGGIGGYTSGGGWGAVAGSVAGGLVGLITPTASGTIGAAVGGFTSNIVGQILGNGVAGNSLGSIDVGQGIASAFSGGAGALATGALGITSIAGQAAVCSGVDAATNSITAPFHTGPVDLCRVATGKPCGF